MEQQQLSMESTTFVFYLASDRERRIQAAAKYEQFQLDKYHTTIRQQMKKENLFYKHQKGMFESRQQAKLGPVRQFVAQGSSRGQSTENNVLNTRRMASGNFRGSGISSSFKGAARCQAIFPPSLRGSQNFSAMALFGNRTPGAVGNEAFAKIGNFSTVYEATAKNVRLRSESKGPSSSEPQLYSKKPHTLDNGDEKTINKIRTNPVSITKPKALVMYDSWKCRVHSGTSKKQAFSQDKKISGISKRQSKSRSKAAEKIPLRYENESRMTYKRETLDGTSMKKDYERSKLPHLKSKEIDSCFCEMDEGKGGPAKASERKILIQPHVHTNEVNVRSKLKERRFVVCSDKADSGDRSREIDSPTQPEPTVSWAAVAKLIGMKMKFKRRLLHGKFQAPVLQVPDLRFEEKTAMSKSGLENNSKKEWDTLKNCRYLRMPHGK